MAAEATTRTVSTSPEVQEIRDQIELALVQRIQASVAQATPQELLELLHVYDELMGRWHRR